MSRVLEDTLVRFDLPYQVIGGTKFYDRAEVKDAVAYLSLLLNPADQVSFLRAVNSPRRGIGNTTQGRLASYANTARLTIWEVAERAEEVPGLSAAAIKAVSRFFETMDLLKARVDSALPSPTSSRRCSATEHRLEHLGQRSPPASTRAFSRSIVSKKRETALIAAALRPGTSSARSTTSQIVARPCSRRRPAGPGSCYRSPAAAS